MKAKLDEMEADRDKMAAELRLAQDRLLEAQSRSREAAEESEARMLKVLKGQSKDFEAQWQWQPPRPSSTTRRRVR